MKTISVIGGDLRQYTVAELLQNDGFDVSIYGFDNLEKNTVPISKSIIDTAQSDILIFPVPVSVDDITINAPFSKNKIYLSEFKNNMRQKTIILGGKIGNHFNDYICYDYLLREEMAVRNAVPTAEGAIDIAISETPLTLADSNVLVIGYGRISKVLCNLLKAFNSNISVATSDISKMAWIENFGLSTIHTNNLSEYINQFDIIFNTAPAVILNKSILSKVSKNCLIIDLSSKPGGVDFNYAKELNLRVIWALSLPGKTAPISAGKIIKATICNILNELKEV